VKQTEINELILLAESLPKEDYVIGTYLIETDRDANIITRSVAIAIEQSTGTWVGLKEETKEVREKYAAKVIGTYEVPDYEILLPRSINLRYFVIRIAFPHVNFENQIPLLLTTTVGNLACLGRIKLLDLEFPESFLKNFKGPKFGVDGIRRILNVYDRPLLNNMIKPCTGITPETGAELCYNAALGGTDIIKDDELLGGSPKFSHLKDRVKKYMEAIKKANGKKGEKTLYTVNITDDAKKLEENALIAIEAGANALMVSYLTVGLSNVRSLAENPKINVPILGHGDFGGAIYSSPYSGVSSPLIMSKLARIAGIDMLIDIVPYGKVPLLREKYLRSAQTLLSPLYHIKKVFPIVAAGVYPGMVPQIIDDLGMDCIVGVGGAIHGHPLGGAAGAKAMRQAIEASIQRIPLEEYAKTHEELEIAIEKWGVYDPSVNIYKDMKD